MPDIDANQKPLFSVVIPTLNSAKTIRKSLESVFALNNPQGTIEVLIIDGESTDNTVDIVKEYKTPVIMEPGKGRGFAYNRGFLESAGEYVAFLDSDAVAPKEWLAVGFNILKNGPTIAAVYFKNLAPDNSSYFQKCVDTLLSKGRGQANGAIYSRSALARVNGFNSDLPYLQEEEVNIKLLENGYETKVVNGLLILHYPRHNLKSFVGQCIESGIGAEKLALIMRLPMFFRRIFFDMIVAVLPFLAVVLLVLHTDFGLIAVFSELMVAFFCSVFLFRSTHEKYRHAKYVFPATILMWISTFSRFIGYVLAIRYRT